ncbi:myo-inositol-1(or 4)-monophosphatase [Thermocatellispora tengchongensis]|uniref:Myo-inositol-1(Or 4)-monophosphatase n=1 Tax=Thermocatellispora tengchongensis TaxID=1073253 RepID=A0A840NX67_9ACTN|nr:inositol monophosphatase [Thermocatellispora tengchongensis]MBB5131802.1 myo-inositol-1(or 4)-monophosphatase [Thermocatellispora tengchongensis]
MDLDHALRVAVEAAEAAGALLLDGVSGAGPRVRAKGGGGDVVTDLDMAAEKLILERLLTGFPGHRVIAEESGLAGAADGEWTWLVDPLDGTNNVAIGLPVYVVGLALCRDGAPVLGVVHEPVTGRTWSAVHGRGAVGPGGRRLSPPYRPTAHGPTVAWTQGHGVRRGDPVAGAVRNALGLRARRVLQLWAPLLAWAMLARGDIDGIVGYRAELVDLPGGLLLAQEAGMAVRGFDGTPFACDITLPDQERTFVACHPRRLDELLETVAG